MSSDATSKMAPRVSRTLSRTQRLVAMQLGCRGVPSRKRLCGPSNLDLSCSRTRPSAYCCANGVRVGKLLVSKRFLIALVEKLIVLAATSFLLFFFITFALNSYLASSIMGLNPAQPRFCCMFLLDLHHL